MTLGTTAVLACVGTTTGAPTAVAVAIGDRLGLGGGVVTAGGGGGGGGGATGAAVVWAGTGTGTEIDET